MLLIQLWKQFWNIETTQVLLQFKTNLKINTQFYWGWSETNWMRDFKTTYR